MLPGQMINWLVPIVKDGPGKLPLRFGQNQKSKSWDIANIEFMVDGGDVQRTFHVKPNLGYARLSWGWAGIMTIVLKCLLRIFIKQWE